MKGLLLFAAFVSQAATDAPSGGDVTSATCRVDLIELNHFIDEEGREVFQQVIFYDWSASRHRFHVRAWRLVKSPRHLPQRRWNPTRVECRWHDDGVLRTVVAPKLRETWTQHDPERANRKWLPEDQRVPLWASRRAAGESRERR